MKRSTLLRAVAAALPALLLSAVGGLHAPAVGQTNVEAATAALADAKVAAAVAEVGALTTNPEFTRLAATLAPTATGSLTAVVRSAEDAALLARINDVASGPNLSAVATALTFAAGSRSHSDYWDHYYRAQQHAGYAVNGAAAVAGVWTTLVVPGVQRCGTNASCASLWVLVGVNLSVAGASYTAFEALAAGLEVAAFGQSAGYIGYALLLWVVVCVYAGQQCDSPPV